ncbi:FliM/FliN family flagellar motor C-terminal domain-containing protein [Paraburkholderia bonniea]|uniref:FliM/FliN family flagellar motor switch protein n=1 Tax=Paraburkholderia bonniea TaxID=2152891 RepID=UPI001291E2EE|nr:FliM/FliN family flagellar motor C-terminal domain-containing protein [Paraburkholderia bonniea]WJF90766.1 FliM/FliN family flagellar motor C-terminal domain-containing protein [Paraburkholderia bonniea]WJF94080.1 FliM/FliN family flagellar motor C-terminal domain-containing protein [Paraburkholderia bonniea]
MSTPNSSPVSSQIQPAASAANALVLDPCTLGRPFHLLENFKLTLQRQIDRHLHDSFNQRHNTAFSVTDVAVIAFAPTPGEEAWHSYVACGGSISVRVERRMLLTLLACHYGDRQNAGDEELGPETATEQRYGVSTGLALLQELVSCIQPDAQQEVLFENRSQTPPSAGARVLRVTIYEPTIGLSGLLEFAIDTIWLNRLFTYATPRRNLNAPGHDTPLNTRIPVTLTAQLLTKEMMLDDVLYLAPGDIIPVRLPETAHVLVEGSRIYKAAIAEQGGMLWLTSFEDME